MAAFLMTWKPDNKPGYWSEDDLSNKVLQPFKREGLVNIPWRTVSTVQMQVGDSVFILKQGKSKWPTGIFARGRITDRAFIDTDGLSRVRIDITDVVDPRIGFFINRERSEEILGAKISARFSGRSLSIEEASLLDKIIDQKFLSLNKDQVEEADAKWTYSEFEAAVDAYFSMLGYKKNKTPYTKSSVNQLLRENALHRRSKASIEYRMQNISAVVEKLGISFLKGYVPARNVGKTSETTILSIIFSNGYLDDKDIELNSDYAERLNEVSKLRKRGQGMAPIGNQKPEKNWILTSNYKRDLKVVAWVSEEARGNCEGCGLPAPFVDSDGIPFLEVHHVVWLSKGGSDTTDNAVALCPNCHRRLHFSSDRDDYKADLYRKINRLKPLI